MTVLKDAAALVGLITGLATLYDRFLRRDKAVSPQLVVVLDSTSAREVLLRRRAEAPPTLSAILGQVGDPASPGRGPAIDYYLWQAEEVSGLGRHYVGDHHRATDE